MYPSSVIWLVDLDEDDKCFFDFLNKEPSFVASFIYISSGSSLLQRLQETITLPDLIFFDLDTQPIDRLNALRLFCNSPFSDKIPVGIIASYLYEKDAHIIGSLPIKHQIIKPDTTLELRLLFSQIVANLH